MDLVVVGMSHKTAELDVRDRASIHIKDMAERLDEALAIDGIAEALLLNTCNRSELYMATSNGAIPPIEETFAKLHRVAVDDVRNHLYVHSDLEAVRHLCSVASGIDSMVVGEHEIMAQLKQALGAGMDAGSIKTVLGRLASKALSAGKRVRSETKLGEGFLSVASVAVKLAEEVFGDLSDARVLILGAGQNSELIADRLHDAGASSIIVSNRNYDRALDLADRVKGEAVRFDDFPREIAKADIIIASTSAPHPMITADQVRTVLRGRPKHPMFVIDLAVPRNVDPDVGHIKGVHLYDLDRLNQFLNETLERRDSEVPQAQAIVEEEARGFLTWMKGQEIVPVTLAVLDAAEATRAEETAAFLEEASLSPKQARAVERLTRKITHSLLRQPLYQLRELACTPEGMRNIELIKALFGIEGNPGASGMDASTGGPMTTDDDSH